jgi:hypothetical protein
MPARRQQGDACQLGVSRVMHARCTAMQAALGKEFASMAIPRVVLLQCTDATPTRSHK